MSAAFSHAAAIFQDGRRGLLLFPLPPGCAAVIEVRVSRTAARDGPSYGARAIPLFF